MDKKYWDNFYKEKRGDFNLINRSTFADFCQNEFFRNKNLSIVELGAGNGRDSLYFAKCNHNVIAIDQSNVAIDIEQEQLLNHHGVNLVSKVDDFVTSDYVAYGEVDVFYSRFTIHAITKREEETILQKVYNHLRQTGLFCIEVRTTKDPLFGVGKDLGDNTFFTDHSRRFIDSNIFLKDALSLRFKLRYFTERNNLSIYKDDNPVLMRIILEK